MQREGKDARAQLQKLLLENQQQQAENQQLQAQVQQLEAQSQMDGDAVRQSESALRKEVAALKAQLSEASQREATQLAISGGADQTAAPVDKTKETAFKELAIDEDLSEEARDSAMKALEVLVASQLAEVEQEAAAKKQDADRRQRAATVIDMESEVQLIDQQARLIRQQTEAEQKKAQAERNKATMEEREKAASDQLKKATERQQKLEARIGEEMMEWLERHRLLRHAQAFVEVVGTYVCRCRRVRVSLRY
eukprot:COSAG04_NODE_1986_length_5067_cov_2.041667_5_plen_252_part_00